MIYKVADNIISPLGLTTEENLESTRAGRSMIKLHGEDLGVHEPFYGSLLDREKLDSISDKMIDNSDKYTFFEKLCILSAKSAIDSTGIDFSGEDVIFVLSTTKGNVGYLAHSLEDERCYISSSAEKISAYFDNPNIPVVVSNACISGVCAQITAVRLLLTGRYNYAVVIGADVLSEFIVSGFQSFKALGSGPCRPYDRERDGLNLGEGVASMILAKSDEKRDDLWQYVAGSIHNDANHISGPSRTGEGSYRVLMDLLKDMDPDDIAFINTHGTSTAYNDEMESIALHRAGLDFVPVNGLKGYYGHTLGAAGVLETVLSMKAADNGLILATKGFEVNGTSYELNISNENRGVNKQAFIKVLSGFGGSNAGICYRKGDRG